MSELTVTRPISRAPTHPGELIREILDDHLRLSVSEAARRMKVSRQSLHAILSGDAAVTAEMALRFGKLSGGVPELYVSMQTKRDLWLAQERLKDELAGIEAVAA